MAESLERFPIRWNHRIEKETLRFKAGLIEKVINFFGTCSRYYVLMGHAADMEASPQFFAALLRRRPRWRFLGVLLDDANLDTPVVGLGLARAVGTHREGRRA